MGVQYDTVRQLNLDIRLPPLPDIICAKGQHHFFTSRRHVAYVGVGTLKVGDINWTVGVALVGWLGCGGLAEDRLVAPALDPVSFITISFVMDGTVSTERDTFPASQRRSL